MLKFDEKSTVLHFVDLTISMVVSYLESCTVQVKQAHLVTISYPCCSLSHAY